MKIELKKTDCIADDEIAIVNNTTKLYLTVSYLWDNNYKWHYYMVISGEDVYYRVITKEMWICKISEKDKIKHIKKALAA